MRGAALDHAAAQTVRRQSPDAGARASSVAVWLRPKTNQRSQTGQTAPSSPSTQVSPSQPEEPRPPCWGSAEFGPGISEPLLTPGPTELVSGFYLDGGPLVGFSAPGCKRPAPPPGGGTVEVFSESGTLVATQTSENGQFAEISLPPGSYKITGTFLGATICTGIAATTCVHATQTEWVVIPAGDTVREDFVLQIA